MHIPDLGKLLSSRPGPCAVALATLLVAVTLVSTGCGGNRIVTFVDVASFMDESDRNIDYDAPPVPVAVTVPVGPFSVTIPEGIGDISEVTEADIEIRTLVANASGDGDIDVRVFFARPTEDLFSQAPAAQFSATVAPGETAVIEETVPLGDEIQNLFLDSEIQFGMEVVIGPAGSVQNLVGQVVIDQLGVRVVNDPNIGS